MWRRLNLVPRVFSLFKMAAAREKTLAHSKSRVSNEDGDVQPRPQGLLAFQYGGGSGEDPGTWRPKTVADWRHSYMSYKSH